MTYNAKIIHGDCLEKMSDIESSSVDFIFADLPYQVTACKFDKNIDLTALWRQYERIIKSNGCIALMGQQPFSSTLIHSNLDWYRYSWYWIKNQGTNFFHAKRMPIRKVEEILIFYKNHPTYNIQFSTGHVPTNSAKGCSNGTVYNGNNKRNYQGGSTQRYPTNVLNFDCVDNYSRIHPSQKPIELLEYLVKTYTNENDTVLDNVAGSGVTGVACKKLNRNCILIEKEQKFYDQIVEILK